MENRQETGFKFKITGGQRTMLMLPFNVILVGRVRGAVNSADVASALEKLRLRHPLLAVRAQFENEGNGSFLSESVPAIKIHTESRKSEEQWLDRIKEELRTSFSIETGPLFRCTLIRSPEVCEIILCAHHTICDGMSLGYLLRDLLDDLNNPGQEPYQALIPPPIDRTTVPNPPASNAIQSFVMRMINEKWAAKGIRFSESDRIKMHDKFWQQNTEMELLAWSIEPEDTNSLVERCRTEHVTVNSALWTAFLAAQSEIQSDRQGYRQRSAMAVNTRDKLLLSVGESFGFYASSLTVKLPFSSSMSFWDNARKVHSKIAKELNKTNLFRMLTAELIHPTLLDSLYFQKYGLLDEAIPKKMLNKMGWQKMAYGYALTNIGRFDIPANYGSLELDSVFGPLFYSDIEEKMVGVITVGEKLSFLHASNKSIVADAAQLKDSAMINLKKALSH